MPGEKERRIPYKSSIAKEIIEALWHIINEKDSCSFSEATEKRLCSAYMCDLLAPRPMSCRSGCPALMDRALNGSCCLLNFTAARQLYAQAEIQLRIIQCLAKMMIESEAAEVVKKGAEAKSYERREG